MREFQTAALLAAALSTSGAIIDFDLGPGGLNGLNERPAPVVTTATGGERSGVGSISLDTTTHQLFLNYSWGDQNGYTDLTGSFTDTHIHGPADVNNAANVLYLLTPQVNQQTATDGGVFGFTLQLVDQGPYTVALQEADLLAQRWYVNVHSQTFTGGEIRGQLVPVPEPEHYVALAAIGLLSFAGYRRIRRAPAC